MVPSQSIRASAPDPSELHLIHFLLCLPNPSPFFSPSLSLLVKMVDCLGFFNARTHQRNPEHTNELPTLHLFPIQKHLMNHGMSFALN